MLFILLFSARFSQFSTSVEKEELEQKINLQHLFYPAVLAASGMLAAAAVFVLEMLTIKRKNGIKMGDKPTLTYNNLLSPSSHPPSTPWPG